MSTLAIKSPTADSHQQQGSAYVNTQSEQYAKGAGQVYARLRQQARATGQAKLGGCIIAETVTRFERPMRSQAELLSILRVKEIERIIRTRHGVIVPDVRGTDDMELAAGYLLAVAGSLGEIDGWARRWMPWLDDPAVFERAHNLLLKLKGSKRKRRPSMLKADHVSVLIGLTMAERAALDIRTIGACDVSLRERKAAAKTRKRQMDRERQERRRRAAGMKPMGQDSISAERPWEAENISRATWYRRHRETKVSLIKSASHSKISVVATNLSHSPSFNSTGPKAEQSSIGKNPTRGEAAGPGSGDWSPAECPEGQRPFGAIEERISA